MKRLYFLFLLCCLGSVVFAQTTVTIYATGGPNITGTSTTAAYTDGDLNVTTGSRGFAVFDLSSIPAGVIVGRVTVGYTVAAYTCGGVGICNTYGIAGNVYTASGGVPATLYADLVAPATASLISTQSYGAAIGNQTISTNALAQNLVQDNIGSKISVRFTDAGADLYQITGEAGVPAPGGAPYLTITYCTAPSTAIIYASEPPGGPITTGSSTPTTFTSGDIKAGPSDASRGYAVFNLSGIPAGSFIGSVTTNFNVLSYTAGTSANTIYGYTGDISTLSGTPGTLFGAMINPTSTALTTNAWGGATGNVTIGSNLATQNFVQSNVGNTVSLSFVNTGTATYNINGETGTATLTGAHAPYLIINYFAPPTGVTASSTATSVCYGSALGLTGNATNANMYAWTGPGGFSSNVQNPVFITSMANSGAYILTASNGCANDSSSAASVITPAVVIQPGPITGVTNVWAGFTTQLSDLAAGGTWTSSNTAVATVDGTGLVGGVTPGSVNITYTTTTCVFSVQVTVINSVFSQIPTIAGASGGLGFPIVAWYPFCADTTDHVDFTGSGPALDNGDPNTAPATLTADRFGIPDNAFAFNGVNSMMWLPTFFPTLGGPTNDFTYSVWMEADTIQNAIIEYNGNPTFDGFGFVMNDGQPWVGPVAACNPYTPVAGAKVSILFGDVGQFVPTTISLHQWHNLVLKKNGNSYDFYIDDVSVGFFISTFNTMTSAFALGMDYASTTTGTLQKAFNGKIDDIAIYNRQLSDAERDSLYNFNPDARIFSLGNDTTICSDSITLVANPPTIGNFYSWGSPAFPLGFSTDSVITVDPAAGALGNQYWLQVGKPYGCFAYDTIRVYKAPIPVNIGADSVSICLGDTITLADPTPHTSLVSYFWNTGNTTNSIHVSTPGYYVLTVDSLHYFTAIDTNGITFTDSSTCVGRDTVHLHVYPAPIIGLPLQYSNCSGVSDTLIAHFDSAYTYEWNNNTALTSDTLIDSAIGTHNVWVKVNDTGCFRIDTVSVQIIFDTLTFLAHDTAICLGQSWPPDPAYLLVTDNHIATYQWTPTSGIPVSNTANPVITPDTSAEYILTVSYPRCPDIVDSFYLDVQPNPTVFPGNNRSVCQFDTIHVVANVTPDWYQHYSYSWTPSTALDASTTGTVVFSPVDTTSLVNLIVTVTTPVGCTATDSVLLFVHPGNFLHDTNYTYLYNVCPGDSIQLMPVDSLPGSTVSSYAWSPGMYLSDSTVAWPWVHPITSLGYRLVGTSQFGCRDTLNYNIYVEAAAVIYLGDSVNIYPGESYLISPQTNCVTFLWSPPLQIDDIHSSTPTVTPLVNTTYIVNASTEAGCTVTDSIRIRISPKSLINIPNAFTPGSGVNDKFYVIPKGSVSLVYFRIFNRWGNKVFETQNIEEGWDGTYNGKPQPFDVYVYEVEAKTIDGEVFQRVGNVTLLR